jgi:hypothetical protein
MRWWGNHWDHARFLGAPKGGASQQARKKAVVANGPKFREETPKKGSNAATPIAVLHCNN